jgi:hypothetical protein
VQVGGFVLDAECQQLGDVHGAPRSSSVTF